MKILLDPRNIEDYKRFLAVKRLPQYRITGRECWFPDEYSAQIEGGETQRQFINWEPSPHCYDYQAAVARLAVRKRKFAAFVRCGLGKTIIMLEFANAASSQLRERRPLIISPLMVVDQTIEENARFYSRIGRPIQQVKAAKLQSWLNDDDDGTIGITNYEALTDDLTAGNLGALLIDESSMLKSMYGKWGQTIIRIGRGLDWKLCLTGTPAPNDRIEYANHAVFLDHFPTVNSFLAKFFVNRGQTDNRWELKPHALEPFYRALSHWCIFLNNPATYGWKDNCNTIPPVRIHIDHIDMTSAQADIVRRVTGQLIATAAGGITGRSTLAQIAKGSFKGESVETRKYEFIAQLVNKEPDRGTIIWAKYNNEQDALASALPDAANISGDTPHAKRMELIDDFKSGRRKVLISKPKILGFGLNLQVATRMIWSGLQDSYEEFCQGIARANRIGSTEPLDVHIPVLEIERPMIETVLRKAKMVDQDTAEQERIFKQFGMEQL